MLEILNSGLTLTCQFLPNLPEKSVIVMDNAPYHCIQENKPPTRNSVKAECDIEAGEKQRTFRCRNEEN
jgi:hypothetical protein